MRNNNLISLLEQEDNNNKRLLNWLYSIAKRMYNSKDDKERKELFKSLNDLVELMGDSVYFNNPYID